jgi:hypothetical protein
VIYKTDANGNRITDSNGNPIPDYFDGGSATYSLTLYVVEVQSVKFGNNDVTNGTITLLKGSRITLTAVPNPNIWPENNPVWSCPNATFTNPNIATITFDNLQTGTTVLTATCGASNKTVTVRVVEPVLESINFEGSGVQDIYDVGSTPEWQRIPSKNEPFSVKKGQDYNVKITISTQPLSGNVCN